LFIYSLIINVLSVLYYLAAVSMCIIIRFRELGQDSMIVVLCSHDVLPSSSTTVK